MVIPEARRRAFQHYQAGRTFDQIIDWLTFQEGKKPDRLGLIGWWFDAGYLEPSPVHTPGSLTERRCKYKYCMRPAVKTNDPSGLCRLHRWQRKIQKIKYPGPMPRDWPVKCQECQIWKADGIVVVTVEDGLGRKWDGNFICRECAE